MGELTMAMAVFLAMEPSVTVDTSVAMETISTASVRLIPSPSPTPSPGGSWTPRPQCLCHWTSPQRRLHPLHLLWLHWSSLGLNGNGLIWIALILHPLLC